MATSFGFGKRGNHYEKISQKIPGPGKYDQTQYLAKLKEKPPSYSIGLNENMAGAAFLDLDELYYNEDEPDPTTYEKKTFIEGIKDMTIPKNEFYLKQYPTPGPSKYKPRLKSTKTKDPQYPFAYQHEIYNPTKNNPGPRYKIQTSLVKPQSSMNTGMTMGSRAELGHFKERSMIPGPKYNPKLRATTPQFKFSRGLQRVGVGAYSGALHRQGTPGPGKYRVRRTISRKRPRTQQNNRSRKIVGTNLPSKCDPKVQYFKDKKFFNLLRKKRKNTKAQKMDFIDRTKAEEEDLAKQEYFHTEGMKIPYYVEKTVNGVVRKKLRYKMIYLYDKKEDKAKKMKFPVQKRKPLYDQTYGNPGPQSYNQDQVEHDHKYQTPGLIQRRLNRSKINLVTSTPGPLDYRIDQKPTKLPVFQSNSYEYLLLQMKFTRKNDENSFLQFKKIQSQGQLDYDSTGSFLKAVKPQKIGVKFPRSKRNNFVKITKQGRRIGPGCYGIPKKRILNSSFSFGKSKRFSKQKDFGNVFKPGPDSYNLPTYTVTAPNYLFIKLKREEYQNPFNPKKKKAIKKKKKKAAVKKSSSALKKIKTLKSKENNK